MKKAGILGTIGAILAILVYSMQLIEYLPFVWKSDFEREVLDLQSQINNLVIERQRR